MREDRRIHSYEQQPIFGGVGNYRHVDQITTKYSYFNWGSLPESTDQKITLGETELEKLPKTRAYVITAPNSGLGLRETLSSIIS